MSEPIVSARIRVPPPNGLRRPRLDLLLEASWRFPLTVVVAPAGSGKTTLLAMFASSKAGGDGAVAWYQAGMADADPARLLRYLESAVRQALPELTGGWDSVDKAAAVLETAPRPLVIVVDDAHTLLATAAESELERLVSYLPPHVHMVLAGRHPPAFDLSRWRLAGHVAEIGPDDLRFRSWEVEELFTLHYGVRLMPEEVAELARRTGGWAAGLSLFRLATTNSSSAERRGVLASLSSRLLDTRDYLTRNVLATLEPEQRDFLVRTCVLGRLSGPWCDQLLKTTGSSRRLDELARRHLFLLSHDGGTTYQEHEVLRSFLEELLLDEVGEEAVRGIYAEAGAILEAAGSVSEALRCYYRAQEWVAADRLLGLSGDRAVAALGPWNDGMPSAVADHDAWYQLGLARRQVRSGHWQAAVETYRRAEELAGGTLVRRTSQRERFQLTGWIDPASSVPHDWTGQLRRALARNPLAGADGALVRGTGAQLAGGLAALAAGHVAQAHAILAEDEDAPERSALRRWAELALWFTSRLTGRPYGPAALAATLDHLDAQVPAWLGRLLHAVAGRPQALLAQLEASRAEAMATENPWADLLFAAVEGCAQLAAGQAAQSVPCFERAAVLGMSLQAPVVSAWAGAAASLGMLPTDAKGALHRAASADQLARGVACPGAAALSVLVEAAALGGPGWRAAASVLELEGVMPMAPLVEQALAASGRSGAAGGSSQGGSLSGPASAGLGGVAGPETGGRGSDEPAEAGARTVTSAVARAAAEAADAVEVNTVDVRCLGKFVLTVGGRVVDAGLARPGVRSLLHFLALHPGEYVHRDVLCATLWSVDDAGAAKHGLQVAVSSLRQLLEAQAGSGAGALVARKGPSYALDLGRSGTHDLAQLEAHVNRGRRLRQDRRNDDAVGALRVAVALYRGELLADEGTVEWVLAPRERYRLMISEASQQLAEALLDLGQTAEAAAAATWGLSVDRYCDPLWKLMIAAHDQGANQAASARARHDYERMLAELGVAPLPQATGA
ncbi:MAG TPA: BTAD domain-containing putative transcriptional regulator [Acidimicrobiales bacterium]|nr:BTAD domain-containing putative transcriptional regulator [Acidimicrobiales bacterium]